MAAFDFPSSPAIGQLFTPAGGPAYVWDGAVWVVIAPGARTFPTSAGIRNAFINGGFDFDQRAQTISGLVGGGWAADRWLAQTGGSAITRTRPAFTPGQAAVPGEPALFLQLVVASVAGAANYAYLVQKLEGVRSLSSNETFTLSFSAMASVARSISFEVQRSYGTGGSPSASDALNCQRRFDLTTAWQRFIHTFPAPPLTGKVIGSNVDDCAWCIFWLDAGANFNASASGIGQLSATLAFANMQLEHGPVATDFERLPPGRNLKLCQRFYESGVQTQGAPNLPGGATGAHTWAQRFKATKRAPATVAWTPSGQQNIGSTTSYGAAVDAHHVQVIGGTTFTVNAQTIAWTANAELP